MRAAGFQAVSGNASRWHVLDEATSALDGATEASVVETIAKLKGQMTIVTITHRPALVAVADRMIEVQHGKVALSQPTRAN